MKLQLKIEEQQKGMVAACLIRSLELAASMQSLDRAEEVLKAHVNVGKWIVGQGGHHVFLSWQTVYGPVRVAMIVEVR